MTEITEESVPAGWMLSGRADQSELARTTSGTSALFNSASFSASDSNATVTSNKLQTITVIYDHTCRGGLVLVGDRSNEKVVANLR